MQPHLSVVLPSYNEMKNLERGVLEEVLSYLKKQEYDWELLLSDDGSTDGTLIELQKCAAKEKNVRVIANEHGGKAPTVKKGMLAAQGKWRLFSDFDQSTPLAEIEKFWPLTEDGYDIIIGSREIAGAKRDKEPWYRHLMGRGFNLLVQTLAVPGIEDTQCGFKLFSGQATETLFPKLLVYGSEKKRRDAFTGAFDVELLFLANQYGYKIKEVPIHWKHFHTDRVSPIKDSVRMLFDILKMRWYSVLGKY
ncbi:MAG TPA: dolichyl-phosphate beta-glucosyltransferase [Patescibacteria group bacterium]